MGGLAKVKVTDKDLAADAEAARNAAAVNYSDDSQLIFLNNRMTHPNKVGGYRRTNQSIEVTCQPHSTKTPLKPAPLVKAVGSAMDQQ